MATTLAPASPIPIFDPKILGHLNLQGNVVGQTLTLDTSRNLKPNKLGAKGGIRTASLFFENKEA